MLARVTPFLLLMLVFVPQSTAGDNAGFNYIFKGRDLAGWSGDKKFWSVEEGAITGRTTAQNPTRVKTFLIWTKGEVDDFVLKL